MAKLKDQSDKGTTQTQEEQVTKDVQTTEDMLQVGESIDTSENVDDTTKNEKEETVTVKKDDKIEKGSIQKNDTKFKPIHSIEPHIETVLKAFSSYEKLYIDAQGGAFPDDAPANIRGKAKLYTNPHFKS